MSSGYPSIINGMSNELIFVIRGFNSYGDVTLTKPQR